VEVSDDHDELDHASQDSRHQGAQPEEKKACDERGKRQEREKYLDSTYAVRDFPRRGENKSSPRHIFAKTSAR
jgi:hypothetical protein